MNSDRERRMIDDTTMIQRGGYNAELLKKPWMWQSRAMRSL
jgi:hypothetical protein